MDNTKTILAFIAGASLGAIAGILMAPDAGVATRKKVIDKSGDLKDLIKENVLNFLDKLEKSVDEEVMQDRKTAAAMRGDNTDNA